MPFPSVFCPTFVNPTMVNSRYEDVGYWLEPGYITHKNVEAACQAKGGTKLTLKTPERVDHFWRWRNATSEHLEFSFNPPEVELLKFHHLNLGNDGFL